MVEALVLGLRRAGLAGVLAGGLFGGVEPLCADPAGGSDATPPCATSRAEAEIQTVGEAMLAWLIDIVSGLSEGASTLEPICPGASPVDLTLVPSISVEDLRALLVPDYIAAVPALDPWGHPYEFRLNVANPLSAHAIALRSPGADGVFETDNYDFGFTSGPDDDLVLYNISRVRMPPRLDPVGRQWTTNEQIDRLGWALLSWYTDHVSARADAASRARIQPSDPLTVDLGLITPISNAAMTALLAPLYTPCVPEHDAWGQPYDLRLNGDLLNSPVMAIRSAGADGTVEGDIYVGNQFPGDDFARDIVWSDGLFFQAPGASHATIFRDDFESGALWGYWSCGPDF